MRGMGGMSVNAMDWRDALMAVITAATPLLFAWACAEAYAERGYVACGGEFGVLALPLIAGALIYGSEED